jgi:mono/diheme cytochrome c family protein
MACLLLAGCSSEPSALREWTPADHAHPPDTQIDPNRVPQKEVPDLSVGELLWTQNCARCHGANAQGNAKVAINFTTAEWQSSRDNATIARTIALGKAPNMPSFASLLTPEQIDELVQQVRRFGEK